MRDILSLVRSRFLETCCTFLTDIDQLFHSALQVNEIEGIILNPWNRTIMLDKNLINIILGNV